MALITFMSDMGLQDHYVASVKANILQVNPSAQIIDISHNIEPFNLAQAAFLLKATVKNFPSGSIHLYTVDSTGKINEKFIAAELEGHFFVGNDNGLLGLISERIADKIVKLPDNETISSFPEKNILSKAAAALSMNIPLETLGTPLSEYNRKLSRQMRVTKNQISGHVIYVDHYGNLITNIEKDAFLKIKKDRNYMVTFGRESLDKIYMSYQFVDDGDCVAIFNDLNVLELAINKGNAKELLGLSYDSPVSITFNPEL
ncbi:MAG TPA: SAM-dependent chlorinase/fluorinase [Cytophagales bacterium]|nr:SAM-dependent chlorinase/fluorinase [Cytophagales bacterium]